MPPAVKLPLWVLVIVRSGTAVEVIVVGSLAESLLVLLSPPPDTVAVLVTLDGALLAMLTFKVIGEALALAAKAVWFVQVTVCPESEQVQPAPLAPVGVNPLGTTSVTVMVPLLPVTETVS